MSFSKNLIQPVKVMKVELIEYLNDEVKVSKLETHIRWRVKFAERVQTHFNAVFWVFIQKGLNHFVNCLVS